MRFFEQSFRPLFSEGGGFGWSPRPSLAFCIQTEEYDMYPRRRQRRKGQKASKRRAVGFVSKAPKIRELCMIIFQFEGAIPYEMNPVTFALIILATIIAFIIYVLVNTFKKK